MFAAVLGLVARAKPSGALSYCECDAHSDDGIDDDDDELRCARDHDYYEERVRCERIIISNSPARRTITHQRPQWRLRRRRRLVYPLISVSSSVRVRHSDNYEHREDSR